jgi:hypothetical protein
MHLVLGNRADLCCNGVLARMDALGFRARLVDAPLAPPSQLIWRLNESGVSSSYILPDFADDEEIESVLVREFGGVDPDGWDSGDYAYMQAELHATLLAWLEGLPCPVVNRCPAALFYRRMTPLLAWRPLLRQCELESLDTIITNDLCEARDFARVVGAGGVVLTPLTGEGGYLVVSESDWQGVAAVQQLAPVCLTEPYDGAQSACIVGDSVIWGGDARIETARLNERLVRFATAAGAEFLEVAVAVVRGRPAIVKVAVSPQLEHFSLDARELILDVLFAQVTRLEAPALSPVNR